MTELKYWCQEYKKQRISKRELVFQKKHMQKLEVYLMSNVFGMALVTAQISLKKTSFNSPMITFARVRAGGFLFKNNHRNPYIIKTLWFFMEKKYFADIVINKEKLSKGEPIFVAHCINLGITSQGSTTEEAIQNIKEAIELYLEEEPEKENELSLAEEPALFSVIEVTKNAKTTDCVR